MRKQRLKGWTSVAAAYLLFASLFGDVRAWGELGHRAVAALAEKGVSSIVMERYRQLLPHGASLASVANWADHVRSRPEWHWTERLHYADTAPWQCSYDPRFDCAGGCNCVVGAIANYTQRLESPAASSDVNETVALMFLVHFVGDLAQPLHVGFRSDRGGNEIHGEFYGRRTNLHAVWDEDIIEHRLYRDFNGSEDDYIEYLSRKAPDDVELCHQGDGLESCIQRWASDSASLACQYAYVDENGNRIESGFRIRETYYDGAIEVIERQLLTAAARLSHLLERIVAFCKPASIAVQ